MEETPQTQNPPPDESASAPAVEQPPSQTAIESSAPTPEPVRSEPVVAPPPTAVSPEPISSAPQKVSSPASLSIRVPSILEFLPFLREELGLPSEPEPQHEVSVQESQAVVEMGSPHEDGPRLRKRKRRRKVDPEQIVPPEADEVWAKLPQYLRYLAEWTDDSVTRRYYPARIRESREELIARLTDPVLTLEEVARLLGVCPATIRRYTDRGWLRHFRTEGNQRRFRLSDVVAFLEEQALRRPTGNRNANQSVSEEADETP